MKKYLAVLFVLTSFLVAGCGKGTPVTVRSAPKASGTISLPAADIATGFVDFGSWPSACDLLTANDIKAILPQTKKLKLSPKTWSGGIDIVNNLGSPVRHGMPANSACDIDFSLPNRDSHHTGSTNLSVGVGLVADPDVVDLNWEHGHKRDDPRDQARNAGTATCVVSNSRTWNCKTPRVLFSVGVTMEPSVPGYVGLGSTKMNDVTQYWDDNVMPRFVEAVSSKLPS